jgi:hypothetical protein
LKKTLRLKLFYLLQKTRRLKPRLYKQNPPTRVEEDSAVKIILSSSVRGGGLRFCRRGFNRRLRFCRRGFNRRLILSSDKEFDINIKPDAIEGVLSESSYFIVGRAGFLNSFISSQSRRLRMLRDFL